MQRLTKSKIKLAKTPLTKSDKLAYLHNKNENLKKLITTFKLEL